MVYRRQHFKGRKSSESALEKYGLSAGIIDEQHGEKQGFKLDRQSRGIKSRNDFAFSDAVNEKIFGLWLPMTKKDEDKAD